MTRFSLFLLIIFFSFSPILAQSETEPYIDPAGTSDDFPASLQSGKLPVIYINTEEAAPIVDKVTPIPAGLYLDPCGLEGVEALGSKDDPIELTIRGRGNTTWQHVKKPYKLKFSKKTSILGLPASKHFALLAHYCAGNEWATNYTGFEIARRLGMGWQPGMKAVELVLNGRYDGVYFLTETIKIAEDRLNIFEQEDGATDSEIIPYGWLIEIDNYYDDAQIEFEETPSLSIRFTFKSPEELSKEQLEWITDELSELNRQLYESPLDSPEWADKLDLRSLARYFIVRELFHDSDGYSGSFYIHRDKGNDSKWECGPLWDITCGAFNKTSYLPLDPTTTSIADMHWLPRAMLYPEFNRVFREEWNAFYRSGKLEEVIADFRDWMIDLDVPFESNNDRWTKIDVWTLTTDSGLNIENTLRNNAAWIDEHQDLTAELVVADIPEADEAFGQAEYFTLGGTAIAARPSEPGIYIMRRGSQTRKIIITR